MTFTSDGHGQRLPQIFYSLLVILTINHKDRQQKTDVKSLVFAVCRLMKRHA